MNFVKTLYRKYPYESRFLIVGMMNTAVGYGSYSLFIFLSMPLNLAYVLSTIIGVANSYILNKFFTFKSKKKSFWELVRFILVYTLSFFIGYIFLPFLVNHLHMNKYLAGICNIFVTTVSAFSGIVFSVSGE